ncbi:hypothetical protein HpBGD53_18710 [Helicobacter pylori]
MGVFLDKSIKDVVDELNVRYFLPDIQREYVWLKNADEKKIEQLFDSILRGYPIGSFLFWKLQKEDIAKSDEQDSDKLNFQLYQFITNYDERKPHNENCPSYKSDTADDPTPEETCGQGSIKKKKQTRQQPKKRTAKG